jgi:alpha-glucosidase
LPMPPEWAALTVEKQLADADSTLSFFRHAIEIRHSRAEFAGEGIDWLDIAPDALAFARHGAGLRCVLNTGKRPLPLPDGEVLLASAPTVDGKLPANAAAWLASTPTSTHNR